MFVTYLKENGFLCHDKNEIEVGENRQLFCKKCKKLILDVNKHLTEETLPMLSSFLAKHYATWTGDLHVPCRIVIKGISGIEPCYVKISYFNLLNTIQLLGTANQEFILCTNHQFDVKSTLKAKILENFINNYMTMVNNIHIENDKNVEEILKFALRQMKENFNTCNYNIFKYYFDVICPYIKTLDSTVREEVINTECPGEFFLRLSKNATEIRSYFGKYCLPFDMLYVMIYCFACHENLNVVINFVLDLIARICNKYFDEPVKYHDMCKKILDSQVCFSKNTPLYHLVKNIREGRVAQMFNEKFYNNFAELQQLISTHFNKAVSTPSEMITKFAFSQSFPFILFPESSNYYGFVCMIGYGTSKINFKKGTFEPKTCENAKAVMFFIENYIKKMRNFANGYMKVAQPKNMLHSGMLKDNLDYDSMLNTGDSTVEFWTLEVFQLFLSVYQEMEKDLNTFINLLLH